MAAWRHGLRSSVVTDAAALRYWYGPEAEELLERYAPENVGDPELALGMACKRIIRLRLFEEIHECGVDIEEPILNSEGEKVGVRIKVSPAFKAYIRIDKQIGARRRRLQAVRHEPTAAEIRRARIRAQEEALEAPGVFEE